MNSSERPKYHWIAPFASEAVGSIAPGRFGPLTLDVRVHGLFESLEAGHVRVVPAIVLRGADIDWDNGKIRGVADGLRPKGALRAPKVTINGVLRTDQAARSPWVPPSPTGLEAWYRLSERATTEALGWPDGDIEKELAGVLRMPWWFFVPAVQARAVAYMGLPDLPREAATVLTVARLLRDGWNGRPRAVPSVQIKVSLWRRIESMAARGLLGADPKRVFEAIVGRAKFSKMSEAAAAYAALVEDCYVVPFTEDAVDLDVVMGDGPAMAHAEMLHRAAAPVLTRWVAEPTFWYRVYLLCGGDLARYRPA